MDCLGRFDPASGCFICDDDAPHPLHPMLPLPMAALLLRGGEDSTSPQAGCPLLGFSPRGEARAWA